VTTTVNFGRIDVAVAQLQGELQGLQLFSIPGMVRTVPAADQPGAQSHPGDGISIIKLFSLHW
jgi:hypothetical protein